MKDKENKKKNAPEAAQPEQAAADTAEKQAAENQAAGQEKVLDRIRKLKLPYHSTFGKRESYMEQLLWGELGDYVRQLLRGKAEADGKRR